MLTSLKIKNAYSIKEIDLSFIKGKYAYKKDMIYQDIVNPVGIYGDNGSGKSSVVNAINDLINLLIADKEKFYPFIANFNDKGALTEMELMFRLDEVTYTYSVSTSFLDACIEHEFLLCDNKPIFTRNKQNVIIEDKEYEIEDKLLLAIRDLYSKLDELKDAKKHLRISYDYLSNMSTIKGDSSSCNSKLCNFRNIEELISSNTLEIKRVISEFKDFPLFDFTNENGDEHLNLYLKNDKNLRMPIFLASDGMVTICKILAILINLDRNSLLVIDGIEKNLHPKAVSSLIKEAQKREIQILFTSHNTNLMQELRPDQIYFARWKQGGSYYFRLSNIHDNIREINNIEKMYLSNTFDRAINQIINIDE